MLTVALFITILVSCLWLCQPWHAVAKTADVLYSGRECYHLVHLLSY